MLSWYDEKCDLPVYDGLSEEARSYVHILKGYDTETAMAWMQHHTPIPEDGNLYVPSDQELEQLPLISQIQDTVFGGMEIEAGYCNGRNTTLNGYEYHKVSEVNLYCDDVVLYLGHVYDIKENRIDASKGKAFFFPAGTLVELYGTTLHLSPIRTKEAGFRAAVILPEGVNTDLTDEEKKALNKEDPESILLLKRGKWVLAHPERKPLIDQGAWPGFIGENKELSCRKIEKA
ncbi:MAG: DUF4867 family protein [Lactimicrobium sp.]|jgi:hypothetical protein|uniref:DUF4867 family protein n=1 Tax=Lactimicrobium sp. TaxID=2563780 RepID=UPI002F351712